MISFTVTIEKFNKMGEKTGWTYFEIPVTIAEQLAPNHKVSFRVKGFLDNVAIKGIALLPMGEGNFIMALKNDLRKQIKKGKGDTLQVRLEKDKEEYQLNVDMMECLLEDKTALQHFKAMPKSHQNYFSKYIEAAKSDVTKAKRIAMTVNAMILKQTYAEMLRNNKPS